MDKFTLFHFYLIFFLLGLGYTVIAVLMGQLMGGHEAADGHDIGGTEAGVDHDWDAGGAEAGVDHDWDAGGAEGGIDHDLDVGDADAAEAGGHEADHDAGHDHGAADVGSVDAMPQLSPLSPVTIATFATSFGGAGVILDKAGLPGFLSVPAAASSGLVIAVGVFYLFYRVFSITQSTSSVSPRQAIGGRAEVITSVPENGIGEIAYVLGGRRFNAAARSEDGHAIRSGTSVSILRQSGALLYVEESAEERLKKIIEE